MSVKIFVADYSKYSFVVSGDGTKDHKEVLKNMGGKWNPNLSLNGTPIKGWIFSLKKKDEVRAYLEGREEPVNIPFAKVVEDLTSCAKVSELVKDFTAFDTATKSFANELMSSYLPKVEMVDKSTQTDRADDEDDSVDNLEKDLNKLVVEKSAPKLDNTYFACECGIKVLRKNRVRHLDSLTHKQMIAGK